MRWTFWRRSAPPITPQSVVTGNFNLTATLGSSGRTMQMAGYLYYGEDQKSIEDRIAMMRAIMEKEQTIAVIPELEAKREQMIKGMKQAREVLNELLEKQKTGSLSSQERMNVKNMQVNIFTVDEEIKRGDEAIQEAKNKAGVG